MKTVKLLALIVAFAAALGFVGYAVTQNSQSNRLAQINKDLYPAESVKSDTMNSWLANLRRVEGMIQPLEVVKISDAQRHLWFIEQDLNAAITAVETQPQLTQHLLALNEMLNPPTAATTAIRSQRDQRLWELNEKFYPSAREQSGCGLSRTEPDC